MNTQDNNPKPPLSTFGKAVQIVTFVIAVGAALLCIAFAMDALEPHSALQSDPASHPPTKWPARIAMCGMGLVFASIAIAFAFAAFRNLRGKRPS
jgi:TRAP-type C4-dicarboxylate transport system permease small subunit